MKSTAAFWLVCLLVPAVSLAQGSKPASKDKEAEVFDEIERGFYVGVTGGPWFLVNPPASSGPRPFSPGQMAQVEAGLDLGDRLSLGLFVMGSANRAGSDYTGKSAGLASGDFSAFTPGAVVRANLLGFNDSQGIRRTWLYVRAGAGFSLYSPKVLLPDPDVLVFGGAGVEYYTRLRHFSIGLELSGALLVPSSTFGFAVTPSLRYAF